MALREFSAALVPHLSRVVELARDPTCLQWRSAFTEILADLAVHTPDVLEPLRALLRDARPAEGDDWNSRWSKKSVREFALRGLATLRSTAAAALIDVAPLVADHEEDVRRWAVYVLGLFGDPAAVPPLCRALADSDELVRVRAAEALAGLGDVSDEPVAALVRAVADREAKVRRAAVDALNKLKASTDAVRVALVEAASDDDKRVAERAAIALRKVTPRDAKEPKEPKERAPKSKGKKVR
jgi:HEAT repeat protein